MRLLDKIKHHISGQSSRMPALPHVNATNEDFRPDLSVDDGVRA